jgi:hypothetical protein
MGRISACDLYQSKSNKRGVIMGYYMTQTDTDFFIPASNFDAALAAIKGVMSNQSDMHGGSYAFGEQVERWYSWVNSLAVLESETLADALSAWRWEPYTDEEGVYQISFSGEKSGQDDVLFRAIAPYVKAGSYVAMRGEDGALWRWYFDGATCVEQTGTVTYQ